MLATVYEGENGSEELDEQYWINQYWNSPYESDDEVYSEFDFSGISYNAFRLSDNAESHCYAQETIDERSELVISMGDNREDYSRLTILNYGQPDGRIYSVFEYNEKLVPLMNSIFGDILVDQCKTILYYKLSENAAFRAYIDHARNLQSVRLKEASPDEKLALFINIYNMMTIHTTYLQGPPRNIWDRRKLMNCTYYLIDDHKYAPHSILDGILRSNCKGLEMLWKPFGKKDARLSLILPYCEPLIHFALNNGTRSTHSLRAYTCKNVRSELREIACDAFEADKHVRVDMCRKKLYLSKLFQWYAMDFGCTTAKVVEWILWVMEGSDTEKRKNIEMLYHSGHYEVDYIPYDWSFNGKMKE
uniref:DUF547 domain-containing protein n=1 Tax=Haemonchus contortus TaxID=6289 RepID=A0A912MJJ2_HAECO